MSILVVVINNDTENLPNCLSSINNQTIKDLKVIVVDNKDPVQALLQVTETKYDYYAICSSKDIFYPEYVEKSIDIIKTQPNIIGLTYTDFLKNNIKQFKESFSFASLYFNNIVGDCFVINRKVIDKLGIKESTLLDLFKIYSQNFMFYHIPQILRIENE